MPVISPRGPVDNLCGNQELSDLNNGVAGRAGKNSIGVAILLLLGLCNTIIGHPWAAWAILLISKLGAILLQYYFSQPWSLPMSTAFLCHVLPIASLFACYYCTLTLDNRFLNLKKKDLQTGNVFHQRQAPCGKKLVSPHASKFRA